MTERVRDPEMSAAAKRRRPPPNPWPELRNLRTAYGQAQSTVQHLNDRVTKGDQALERMARITALKSAIMDRQDRLTIELTPRWFRDTAKIKGLEHDIAQLYAKLTREEGA